jgi:anaerobic selenocysteine-containing dehydrogenase
MGTIHHTSCVLCAQNCGLEVEVQNNRIIKVKGDKDNVRSEGYICRKGMNIAYHQHNADRLRYPLKKVGDRFERISWDQAIDEIAVKLKKIVDQYGPRSFAYMGGGGQGCHFEAAFGVRLLRGLGSHSRIGRNRFMSRQDPKPNQGPEGIPTKRSGSYPE